MTKIRLALFALIAFAAGASPAYAYLDPGTGSMLLQAILGGVAGVVIAGRLYWGKLKEWVSHFTGRN